MTGNCLVSFLKTLGNITGLEEQGPAVFLLFSGF